MKEVHKHNEMNKSRIIKKIKFEDKNMISLINEGFENADNYLKINLNLIIGRKIKGPRFDKDKNLIPYSIIGDPANYEAIKKRNGSHNLRHFICKAITSIDSRGNSEKTDTKRVYDYIEEEKISQMYDNISSEIQKNEKTSNDFMKEVPLNIKKELQMQELRLYSKNKSMDITNEISKKLARKTQKSLENLLINKIDEHRIKKEFVENVLNKSTNSYERRIPITNWNKNLRQFQIDYPSSKNIDIIRNPLSKTKLDFNKYFKNRKLIDSNETTNFTNKINSSFFKSNSNSKNSSCTDSFNTFNSNLVRNEMMVNGKSLLECEMKITNQLNGKRIIYKKDYLNSFLSGPIHASEINEKDKEKNISNLTSRLDIISNYGSNHSRKGGLLKINMIK